MLLQATFGNESFSVPPKTYQLGCLYETPAGQSHPAQRIAEAVRDMRSTVRAIGSPENIPSSNRSEKHGLWTIGRYDVPEFSLIRLEMQRRYGGMLYEYKHVILRMREEAALRQVRIPFSGHPHASMICGYYEGRFDIIRPEWFETIAYTPRRADLFDQSDLSDWLTETITEREISPFRPVVTNTITTASGKAVAVPARTGHRKLTIRKKD